MSYKDTIIDMIDQDIKWHQENNPEFEQYTEKENQIFKEAFIKGLTQSKIHVNQVWNNDVDNPVEAVEDLYLTLQEYMDESDIEDVRELFL